VSGVCDDSHFGDFAASAGCSRDGNQWDARLGDFVIAHVVSDRAGVSAHDRHRFGTVNATAAADGHNTVGASVLECRKSRLHVRHRGIGINPGKQS